MSRLSLNNYPNRYTPSPSKSTCSSYSKQKSIITNDQGQIYPQWLLQRNDFQEIFQEYESIDKLDLFPIFQKDHINRKDTEIHAIDLFIHSSLFFSNIFNARSLIRNFYSQVFNKGESLYSPLHKQVHIILKGRVLFDKEIKLNQYNAVGELQINENKDFEAIACEKVSVISVDEENYKILFMHMRLKQLKEFVFVVKNIPYFNEVKQMRVEKIVSTAILLQYDRNEYIYYNGDNANYFFVIIKGMVELSSQIKLKSMNNLPIGFKKREKLIIEENYYQPVISISENQVFGLLEAVSSFPRKTTAKTTTSTILLGLKWPDILEIITEAEKSSVLSKLNENFNGKSLTKMLRTKLVKHKKHISALMQASDIKNTPYGRDAFHDVSKRKKVYAKNLFEKHNEYVAENLVSKSYSFRDVILPKITRFN